MHKASGSVFFFNVNNDTPSILRKINANARRKLVTAAKTVPVEIVEQIKSRVVEAINSGEPHKCTAGWVYLPFVGKADTFGLIEVAATELRAAQRAKFAA